MHMMVWATIALLAGVALLIALRRHNLESRRRSSELKRLEEERSYLMSSAHCLLWWADIEDRGHPLYLHWEMHFPDNMAAQRFLPLALEAGEAYKDAFYRLRLPEDRERCDRLGTAYVRAGRSFQQDFRCQSADDSVRWLQEDIQVEIVTAGKRWRAVGVCTDITERKRAEDGVRVNEELFRSTFEQAAVGIAHVAPDGRWLRMNRKLCEIVGYGREELLQLTFQDITHPEDLNADLANVGQVLAGEIPTYSMEKRYFRKDGTQIWINLTVALVRQPSGEPDYFISVVEDITERKRLEDQLLQAQKLESVGRLAGGVAHDFNNLLTAILGYAELAAEDCQNDATRENLHNIAYAAEKAAGLTRQLLAFARRQVIEPRVVNLNDLALSLHKMLRRLIGENIELVMLPQDRLHFVKIDPGQFEQMLVNLVINARDAMPDGGKITVETRNVVLDEDYARQHEGVTPGEYVMLAVSDTGSGMDEAIRLHIFEPFFTTKEKGRGTGLGLATVYGVVKQAGGHIWLYSDLGMGTTFRIYLPHITAPVDSQQVSEQPVGRRGGTEILLLVEDEPSVRALAARALSGLGYQVWEASNGVEALRMVKGRETEVDLLVTDVVMPQMSGRELADRLRAIHPGLKILYTSGYTENTIVHHSVLEPGLSFLAKPFTPSELAQKVREVLDGKPIP